MTSRIIRPVERGVYDFSGLATSGAATITLARQINVTAYKEVTVYTRLHTGTSVTATLATNSIAINADGYTDEDPASNDANNAVQGFQSQVASITLGTSPGSLVVTAVPSNFGSMLSLFWSVKPSVTGTIRFFLSMDLICKEY